MSFVISQNAYMLVPEIQGTTQEVAIAKVRAAADKVSVEKSETHLLKVH